MRTQCHEYVKAAKRALDAQEGISAKGVNVPLFRLPGCITPKESLREAQVFKSTWFCRRSPELREVDDCQGRRSALR